MSSLPGPVTGLKVELAPPPSGDKQLLQLSDFTYLGYYPNVIGPGMTYRYENNELHFIARGVGGYTWDFTCNVPIGTAMPGKGRWSAIGGIMSPYWGLYWDENKRRLFTVTSGDYTSNTIQVQIYVRTLNDDGTISNLYGPIGLQSIDMKRVYGGVQEIPSWFRQKYNLPQYLCGWGGYTSLMAQGGGASLGLTAYAFPEPTNYPINTSIPLTDYKICSDHLGGTIHADWWNNTTMLPTAPTNYDRGKRITSPINYFDGGDPRQNPTTPPTNPPLATANWLSPAPDGFGRWTWGEGYFNTGCWIDGPTKHGFVTIFSGGGGKCYYMSSTLHYDKRQFELHIFDPDHLAEAANRLRLPGLVQPVAMKEITDFTNIGSINLGGFGSPGNAAAAVFDPITKRLYVNTGDYQTASKCRLHVFAVNV